MNLNKESFILRQQNLVQCNKIMKKLQI